jgi:hypothetical protein
MAAKSSFPFFELLIAAACGGVVYYVWFSRHGGDEGRSLWPALGFPYGPLGNLPATGGVTRTGNQSGSGINGGAIPTWLSPTHILTDELGNWLTDQRGNYLTDQGGYVGPFFPSRNATAIRDTRDPSGARPS